MTLEIHLGSPHGWLSLENLIVSIFQGLCAMDTAGGRTSIMIPGRKRRNSTTYQSRKNLFSEIPLVVFTEKKTLIVFHES